MGSLAALLGAAAFLPALAVIYVVGRQNKTFAALAQMGSMQARLSVESPKLPRPDPARLAKSIKMRDKVTYTLGVLNVAITGYLIGAFPTLYYLWHSPKIVAFTLIRWYDFRQKGQHYLLYDFCYWANAVLLLYLWVLPQNTTLFQVCWCLANGPLAWSSLAFTHSLIFHSYPHLTSVIIHVSPSLLVHGLRFYPSDRFQVCDDFPECSVSLPQMVWDSLRLFYVWWIVLYYIWVFVLMGDHCKRRGYQTLFDRVVKGPAKFLARVHPHHLVQKAAYAGMHLIFGVVTMTLAALMWHSFAAHVLFVLTLIGTVSYNAAAWYFEVFLTTYETQVMERAKELEKLY